MYGEVWDACVRTGGKNGNGVVERLVAKGCEGGEWKEKSLEMGDQAR
jgi:hypothetical protein